MHQTILRQIRRLRDQETPSVGVQAVLEAASRALYDLERDRDVASRTMDELSRELEDRLEAMRQSELRYRTLFDMSPYPSVLLRRADRMILGWNAAAARAFGWERLEVIHRAFDTLGICAGSCPLGKAVTGKGSIDPHMVQRATLNTRSGGFIEVEAQAMVMMLNDGESVLLILRDVTALHEAERSARESAARFSAFFDHAGIAVQLLTLDGTITEANPACREILGYGAEELTGHPITALLDHTDTDAFPEACAEVTSGIRDSVAVELPFVHRNGSRVWAQVTLARVHRDDGTRLMAMLQDVTGRKRMELQLERQAFRDDLTGLANRVLFRDRLQHALERRSRTRSDVAVLLLDLDGFKRVNDSLGHAAGDELLRIIGQRIAACVRVGETVARLGGDEFAIVIESMQSPGEPQQLAERLLQAVAMPAQISSREVVVNVSIGIAIAQPAEDGEAVLRDADTAMYAAKGVGKQCIRTFDPSMHANALTRMELEQDLRRALANKEFVLHFQPLVHLNSGILRGFEALVRWNHPQRGMVSPGDFLAVAEETGLIVPIGRWVLYEACARAASWVTEPGGDGPLVSVNLAARQVDHPDLLDDVRRTLKETKLAPHRLMLEITESEVMRNPEVARGRLQALRELGIRVAIDDFGTGYSSLSHLQYFPVDELKIDQSFVARLDRGEREVSFVRTMVALAHSLDVEVVAEGIELTSQSETLERLGCHTGQGYLFGRPLDAMALQAYLARSPLASACPEPQAA
ncbi:MAG TPA: EAL domain-containing protein [Gemmatimonas sp.]|uniref:putative bifunctional diguanylate cyclase/phosphodiesterase n=1 Tax=Gemmatimonas sp. TaxID=1962908 RepID=UPI002ED83B28